MTPALLFVLVLLRGVMELIIWLIVGRAVLRLLAGPTGDNNVILRLFDVVLNAPRTLVTRVIPGVGFAGREWVLFGLLISLWLALGMAKWWLLR